MNVIPLQWLVIPRKFIIYVLPWWNFQRTEFGTWWKTCLSFTIITLHSVYLNVKIELFLKIDCNSKRTTSECSTDSQDSGIVNTSPQPSGADLTDTHHVAPPSVLITQVSADELEDPESPYVKKCIRVSQDLYVLVL